MNIKDIQLLYDYNYWANQLILTTASKLTPEQLTQPTSFSWGSLQGTLVHILDSEYVWRNLCYHNRFTGRLVDSESFPTFESVGTYWEQEEARMRDYINSLSDDDMENTVRYEIPEGIRERVLWHCLVHCVNHGTQHRAECAAMLTDLGHSPGGIDFTLYMNLRVE